MGPNFSVYYCICYYLFKERQIGKKIKRKGPPGLRPKKKKQRETHKPLQSE
jgi:hypothetical protein